ncbi:MAG: hypothetical protein JWQ79_424 [Mucilaginibacter sp.]|nr:hypothetical protein [Mucilaginibacter sp.]
MKKYQHLLLQFILFLLILLWIYTASSKLLNFAHFKLQMRIQILPHWLSRPLVYVLPPSEIIAGLLLLFSRTRLAGLYLSFFLMCLFTGYVGMVISNYFGRTPCSCGGVLQFLGWRLHFAFNLLYLLFTATGIYIVNRERRMARQG